VAASVTLVTATPILLAIYAVARRRDRPDSFLLVLLALASVGILLIGAVDMSASAGALLGDALALLGAVAMAGYMLTVRPLGSRLDVVAFSGIATATGAVTLLFTAFCFDIPIRASSPQALGFILLAALLPQMVGHTLLTWSLRHTTPTAVALATVAEPVGAALLAWAWLGESVGPVVAIGCVITMVAVGAAVLRTGAQDSAGSSSGP